jgi:hypothetical protein
MTLGVNTAVISTTVSHISMVKKQTKKRKDFTPEKRSQLGHQIKSPNIFSLQVLKPSTVRYFGIRKLPVTSF